METDLRNVIMPLAEEIIKQVSHALENRDRGSINFYWLEQLVLIVVSGFVVKLLVGLTYLLFGKGYEGSSVECDICGRRMKFQRYAKRSIISPFGEVKLERAYYYCRTCKIGKAPLDSKADLESGDVSPRLRRIISFHAAHLSFGVVEKSINESFELEVSEETIRRVSEGVGEEARKWEARESQVHKDEGLKTRSEPKTWIIEIDGKMVGFQDGGWNEVKVGVIYELSDRVEISTGRHELVKRELMAMRCGWQEFVPYFWAGMHRVGIAENDRIAAIADGAESLEQIFSFVASESTRIRDFYHVAEKIHAIGELRFGAASQKREAWVGMQLSKLKESDVSGVIRSISHLQFDDEQAKTKKGQVLNYLDKNRSAMEYGEYQEQGLPIGSGAVEGGCRLIGLRTNGCGRRWGVAGCDQIVALRVAVLNDRLDSILPKPSIEKAAA